MKTTTATITQLESDIRKWKAGEINSDSMSRCLREAVYSFDDGVDDRDDRSIADLLVDMIPRPPVLPVWADLEATVDELRADVSGATYK